MSDALVAAASGYAAECIEAYAERCRQNVPEFVKRHFSLEETWRLQQNTLWADLLLAPLNSAWAVPYLAAKKAAGMLDALGAPFAARVMASVPSGIKTGYQRTVEAQIAGEVLEWESTAAAGLPQRLVDEWKKNDLLRMAPLDNRELRRSLRAKIETFSSGRAVVSNVAASLLTIACGWLTLGNPWLTASGIAGALAKRDARNRAASHFLLGRRVGSAFYHVFPPAPSRSETLAFIIVVGGAITLGSVACTILSDPLRKLAGLHARRLSALVDDVERELLVFARKGIKRANPAA